MSGAQALAEGSAGFRGLSSAEEGEMNTDSPNTSFCYIAGKNKQKTFSGFKYSTEILLFNFF